MNTKPTYAELVQRIQELENAKAAWQQTETAMRKREERLTLAITGTGVGLWDWDMQTDRVHFAPKWKHMLGYEQHEINNTVEGWKQLWHPADKDRIERAVEDHITGKTSVYEIEHRLRHKDGSWRWILARGDIVRDADGNPLRWVGTHLDITERKQAEEALRESQQYLSRVINENPFPIWIGDSKGTLLECNQALLDLLQLEEHQLVGKYNISEDPLLESFRPDIRKIFEQGKTWHFEVEWQAKPSVGVASKSVVIAGAVFPTFNQRGEIVNTVATYHDITAQKVAQEKLQTSLGQLKQLTKHLQSVREQERATIARELHDELAQVLTGINLGLHAIAKKLPESDTKLKSRLKETAQLASTAIKSARRIVYELRPSILGDLGLAEAISHQIADYQRHSNIKFVASIEPDMPEIDDTLSTAIFRIFQEAVTNAIRYARATEITVDLKTTDTAINLQVHDNGIGINDDHASRIDAFGILGMQERAESFNGSVNISGGEDHGTTVVASFPATR